MMKLGKRGLKKRAEGLRQQILNHENKIRNEQAKQTLDEGKIHHWEAEIKAFKNSLARVLRRLEK
jgi:hypothetical protein